MTTTLQELNKDKPKTTLAELNEARSPQTKINIPESNTNFAAKVALLTSDPHKAEQAFRVVNSEMNDNIGSSDTADTILSIARQDSMGQTREQLIEYLADPSIPDEDKRAAAEGVMQSTPTVDELLTQQLLAAPNPSGGREESPEVEFVRLSLADSINEIEGWYEDAQSMLNAEVASLNTDSMKAWADIFQYFTPFVESKVTGELMDKIRGGDKSAYWESFTLMGNLKSDMRDIVRSMPVNDRYQFIEYVMTLVNEIQGNIAGNENDYAKLEAMRLFLDDGYYGDMERLMDNAISILDLSIIGGMARRGLTMVNNMRTRVQPSSVSQRMKDTNPDESARAHAIMSQDETEEAARVMYGAGRSDSIANDLLPETPNASGTVRNKTNQIDRILLEATEEQHELFDFVRNRGAIQLSPAVKERARSRVITDFEQAQGLTPRTEMNRVSTISIDEIDDGVRIQAVYGPSNSGFSSPRQAVETVKVALRKYGLDDRDITLLRRDGSEYRPVSLREAEAEETLAEALAVARTERRMSSEAAMMGSLDPTPRITGQSDYLVQVDHAYKFNPWDVGELGDTVVNYNILDRLGFAIGRTGQGSLTRMLFDAASMFSPEITRPLFAAVERSAEVERRLISLASRYTDRVTSMPRDRQELISEYILEANQRGLDFDVNNLIARGFTGEEIDAIRSFKEYWDVAFVFRNGDLAKTLRSRGFQEFVDSATDTRLIVRPLENRQAVGNRPRVYDQETDTIRHMTKQEVDELYEGGGHLARTKSPIQVGDESVDLVVAANQGGKSFVRAINENTQILNYRPGYFPVTYTDPRFIERVFVNPATGSAEFRAVATAGNTEDAQAMVARLNADNADEAVSYRYRSDRTARTKDEVFEDEWNMTEAKGMSAQKVRGQRLQGSTASIDDLATAPVLNPVDTMVSSVRSVAERASMRDVIDTYKQRTLQQFSDYLPVDPVTRQPYIPSNVREVKYRGRGQERNKDLGDARSHVEYISFLENSYVNTLDDIYKRILKQISEIAGERGSKRVESVSQWLSQGRGPTSMAKNGAFNLYLALNPARQIVIQGHQATQLIANFPRFMSNPQSGGKLAVLTQLHMTDGRSVNKSLLQMAGLSRKEATDMYKHWRDSGLAAAVDKHSLIRGSLTDLADRTAGRGFGPLHVARKIGFDTGETFSRMNSWLAHRDEALRTGQNMGSRAVQENVAAQASNYIYAMHRAGDMPYNVNTLGAIFQFLQVPHKAMLAMTTNRLLTPRQRLNLLGFNALMYSMPASAMYLYFGDFLPEDDGETIMGVSKKDLMISGLQGALMNKALTLSTGEETYIDWRGLAPNDQHGLFEFVHSLFTGNPGEAIANSPAGQLFFPGNSRMSDLASTASRYFNFVDDYEGQDGPTLFSDVIKDAASMTSGFSGYFRARMALNSGQKLDRLGGITDQEVTTAEAIAMGFGFTSRDETARRFITTEMYNETTEFREDVEKWYDELKRQLLKRDITPRELEYSQRVLNSAWLAFGEDSYRAKDLINEMLTRDINDGDTRFHNQVLDMQGILSNDRLRTLINQLPDTDDYWREGYLRLLDDIELYTEED